MNTARNKTDYAGSKHRRNFDQYIGKQFNRWTVIEIMPELSCNGSTLCKVRCSCNKHTERIIPLCEVKRGRSKSCGCLGKEISSRVHMEDLTGKKFNRLTALYKTGEKYSDGSYIWHCQCECGKFRDVPSHLLKKGYIKECQECSLHTHVEAVKKSNTKYDDFERAIAHVFNGMQQRCYNPKDKDYHNYGARGIDIEQDWLDHIEHFVAWAKATGYRAGMTIERIKVNKGYHPGNCTWKDRVDQQNNLRSNHSVNVDGRQLTITQCARILGRDVKHAGRVFKSDQDAVETVRSHLAKRSPLLPDPIDIDSAKRELERHIAQYGFKL